MNAAIAAGQRHILIVEDEKDMCLILDVLLESKSLKITHARNLWDAQQSFNNFINP